MSLYKLKGEMLIDGRGKQVNEILLRLRELFSDRCLLNDSVEVLTDSLSDAKRIKAFASMSGCGVQYRQENDHYRIAIQGGCGCG